jgi:hypothetical protein
MTPQPTTTQPRNGRRSGTLRAGTRAARGAGVRRRALVTARRQRAEAGSFR